MKMSKMHEAIRRIARERFGSLLHGNSDRTKSSGQVSQNRTELETVDTQQAEPEPVEAEIVEERPIERPDAPEQNGSPPAEPQLAVESQQFPLIKRRTSAPVVFGQGDESKSGSVWSEHLIEAAKRATGSTEAALRRERD